MSLSLPPEKTGVKMETMPEKEKPLLWLGKPGGKVPPLHNQNE
jgi:hypothetical protein